MIAVVLILAAFVAAVLLAAGATVLVVAVALLIAFGVGFVAGCTFAARAAAERAREHHAPFSSGRPCGQWQGRP